jgi:hypothetical protein
MAVGMMKVTAPVINRGNDLGNARMDPRDQVVVDMVQNKPPNHMGVQSHHKPMVLSLMKGIARHVGMTIDPPLQVLEPLVIKDEILDQMVHHLIIKGKNLAIKAVTVPLKNVILNATF